MDYCTAITAGSGLVVIGLLVVAMTHQVDAGTLQRNSGFGIRTAATKSSDAAWTAGHRAAQPIMRRAGPSSIALGLVPTVAVAITRQVDPGVAEAVGDGLCATGYAVVLGLLTWAAVRADRAARRAAAPRSG